MKELGKKLRDYGVSMSIEYGSITFSKDGFARIYTIDEYVIEKSTAEEIQDILINLLDKFMNYYRERF